MRSGVKARYLAIIFVAAVIVPSILLAVLSIRAAGREEAFVEKQLATTLLAEVTHAAGLVSAETSGIARELRSSVEVPSGSAYRRILSAWKQKNPLVGVPFLLSPRYGVLWPEAESNLGSAERQFLQENSDFLSDRSATPVFQNIAVAHQEEVLAESKKLDKKELTTKRAAPGAGADRAAPAGGSSLARQKAVDTFSQSVEIQQKVFEKARSEGEQLNLRVARPTAPSTIADTVAQPPASEEAPSAAPVTQASAAAAPARSPEPAVPIEQRSQFVTTSQLLSQIASQGDYGIIPRFIGNTLTFLFWSRQSDGRIVGCEIAPTPFRERIAGALPSTWSAARILVILDEKGEPLSTPPGTAGRDWRRPFVSQEIGESLPRWEAAAYLTDPSSISAQARSASAVIWILVLILFVSVAGGGTMVLTSVYGEMRMAQKKASFVANVSHELKTPLTSISLFVDLLRRPKKPEPEKTERYLALMAAETERLGRLINNVLDFSSLERGTKKYVKKTVDLGRVVEEAVEGQRARLEANGFRVSARSGEGESLVEADPEGIKQILLNLLSNAEKYSPEKKEIEVEVARSQDGVSVHVRDRGIGVSEKDRERIFREFFRVDDSLTARVPGTGLGLTIARRIARELGGDVTCQARDGGGSDFALRLPAAASEGERTG